MARTCRLRTRSAVLVVGPWGVRLASYPCLRAGAMMLGKGDLADWLLGSLQMDTTKARTRLSWRVPVAVDEALRRTAAGI